MRKKIVSQIVQQTKNGIKITRTNYKQDFEFKAEFVFDTKEKLVIIATPEKGCSDVKMKLNIGGHKRIIIDTIRPHIDPISFFNRLIVIPHYSNIATKNTLNGMTMMYNSTDIGVDVQPDRIFYINIVNNESGKYLRYDEYREIYDDDNNYRVRRNPLTKTRSFNIIDHKIVEI